jgi:IS30 family transposase
MRIYSQLTRGKRYQIRALLKAGNSQSKVAFYLKVHKSTISREIRRNQGHKGYRRETDQNDPGDDRIG